MSIKIINPASLTKEEHFSVLQDDAAHIFHINFAIADVKYTPAILPIFQGNAMSNTLLKPRDKLFPSLSIMYSSVNSEAPAL